jgi:hypothetical protein
MNTSRPQLNGVTVITPHRSLVEASFPPSRPKASYGQAPRTQSRAATDYLPSSTDQHVIPVSRRVFILSLQDFAPPHIVEPSCSTYPLTRPAHYSLSMRVEARLTHEHPHYIERSILQQPEGYAKMAGSEAHLTFFMPSHYDYRQGKTQKRSNLPKRSTETMKTWFDQVRRHRVSPLQLFAYDGQNITKPYPSEKQKAVFSNVNCKHDISADVPC